MCSLLIFGEIYTGTVSCAVSSIDSHECGSRAEPGRADVGYDQRFQAVQKCWNGWFVVEMTSCLPPGEIPANVNMCTYSSKRCRIWHVIRRQNGKEQQVVSLSNVSWLYLMFQRFSSPLKLLLSTRLVALQHLNIAENKSCWTRPWGLKNTRVLQLNVPA